MHMHTFTDMLLKIINIDSGMSKSDISVRISNLQNFMIAIFCSCIEKVIYWDKIYNIELKV